MYYEHYDRGRDIPTVQDSDVVGYSISNCIKDIVDGWVDINNVTLIKAGTCVSENWEMLINDYIEAYVWEEDDRYKYEAVIGELISEDKIFQSRLYGLIHAGIVNTWDCLWKLNDNYGVSTIETRAIINKV